MAKGDWAAMAMWDLLTPSTSQGACGNIDEGDFVGAAMAVWDLLTPSTSQGACGNVDEGDFVGGGHGCVGHPQPGLDPLPKL